MRTLLIILFLCSPFLVKSQCQIEAGENQNICEMDTVPSLNGRIIQANSVASIKWEALTMDGKTNFWASSMLSDTSILDPLIQSHYEKSVTFYLTLTETDGNTCMDSVIFNFSDWIFLTVDKAAAKFPNDTLELWVAAFSNFPIVSYQWSPDYNISDTGVENPKVWNDTTTTYNLLLMDSIGCSVMDDPFEVFIRPTSINSDPILSQIRIFPNPASERIQLSDINEISAIEIRSQQGRLLRRLPTARQIFIGNLPKGVYYVRLEGKNGGFTSKRIIKQ